MIGMGPLHPEGHSRSSVRTRQESKLAGKKRRATEAASGLHGRGDLGLFLGRPRALTGEDACATTRPAPRNRGQRRLTEDAHLLRLSVDIDKVTCAIVVHGLHEGYMQGHHVADSLFCWAPRIFHELQRNREPELRSQAHGPDAHRAKTKINFANIDRLKTEQRPTKSRRPREKVATNSVAFEPAKPQVESVAYSPSCE